MKKISWIITVVLLAICCACLCACDNDLLKFTEYPNAEKYTAGNFTYNATDVSQVEINWVVGDIVIEHGTGETLSVAENGTLPEEMQVHHLIEGKTLKIQFWKSNYQGKADAALKNLKVQVPQNASVKIYGADSSVTGGDLTLKSLLVASVAGNVTLGRLTAEQIDIATVGGNITLKTEVPSVKLDTVSGKIDLTLYSGVTVDVASVSGNISLALQKVSATVNYSSITGKYTAPNHNKVFGTGDCAVSVDSVSGNLTVTYTE